jgi:hypothetical protein
MEFSKPRYFTTLLSTFVPLSEDFFVFGFESFLLSIAFGVKKFVSFHRQYLFSAQIDIHRLTDHARF